MDTFWMIHGIGQREPTAKHATFDMARTEAMRLARTNPGVEFVVLQSIATAKKNDVDFQMMDDAPMVPF